MSVAPYVLINITRDSVGVQRASFGKSLYLSATAAWAERTRTYTSYAAVVEDFVATSPEALFAAGYFGQSLKPSELKIGRSALPPTLVYAFSIPSITVGSSIVATVGGEGVTATEITVTPLADLTFTADNTTETLTSAAHGMTTGDGPYRLTNSGGALPTGLSADTNYWIINLTTNTYQLAASYADAIAETEVTFTSDGTGTHTLQRDANDVMIAQLVDRMNSVVGNNYVAAQVTGAGDTDTGTITADAAGDWFYVKVHNPARLEVVLTHADPGVATDLANIALEDSDWYMLHTGFNSNAYVLAAAAWIETENKQYAVDLVESDTVTAVVTSSDTADDLHTLAYENTSVHYHTDPSKFLSGRIAGRCLPVDPGGESWHGKPLSGIDAVSPFTDTWIDNLDDKRGNSYRTIGGSGRTHDGYVVNGDYIDAIRFFHWLEDEMGAEVFEGINAGNKTPFNDPGIAVVESRVRKVLSLAEQRGGINPGWTVSVPRASAVSAANKTARTLPDVRFEAVYTGAIHKVRPITGSITL